MFESPTPIPTEPVLPAGHSKLPAVLAVVFGLAAAGLGFMTVVEFTAGKAALASLNSAKQQAYTQGQADQKKSDDAAYLTQSESPFRSYIAPQLYGSFEIKFPKNWNVYAIESQEAATQLNITMHPDAVRLINGQDNAYALHILLVKQTATDIANLHKDDVKTGKLKLTDDLVSNIKSQRYDGKFDLKHNGFTVLVPVRDKTIIISTDDKTFSAEFDQILAQSHIVP